MAPSRLDMSARKRPGYNPGLTPITCRILEVLIRRQSVSGEQLIDILYADDPDGGPENAPKCLSVHIHRLRWCLRLQGITIKSFDFGNQQARLCSYALRPEDKHAARLFLERRLDIVLFGPTDQLELFAHA